jgi:single-stranded-DNA-specific exonuclease
VIAHFGLKIINQQPRMGVKKLIKIAVNKEQLSIGDLVFYIGPRINAAGRMSDAKSAVKMLIADDDETADRYVSELQNQNEDRKLVDQQITSDLKEIVEKDASLLKRKTHVFYQEDWHKGVVGIAASRAIELYYRPTIILTKGSDDTLVGSARSVSGFDVHAALEKCSEHLIQFGGHMYAAGMTLKHENLEAFRDAFESVGEEILTEELLTPKVYYDAELDVNEVNHRFYNIINKMAPFGPANMTPVFYAKGLRDDGTGKVIGKTAEHLKLNIKRPSGAIPALAFGMANQFSAIKKADSFEACFQINENIFRGSRTLQLMLKDVRFTNDV